MKSNLIKLSVLALVIFTCASFTYTNNANASLAGFDPGRIMDDAVMSNKTTMSESDIQSFLKSKNSCNDTDYNKYQYYTSLGYSYNWQNGHFVCMADESFNGETAAHIIWQTAQDYNINPQVLIVLLQKEQSLITDTWPNSGQYMSATGFACYDNGQPCQGYAAGFKIQLRKAANLFHEVLDNRDYDGDNFITNYPVGVNSIFYNPDARCGASNVNVQNRATSALYRYTPYQPNTYALSGGYVSAYPQCGAFGNRNFYDYFTGWFGGTFAPDYSWSLVSQLAYTDNTKSVGSSLQNMLPGQKAFVTISVKNMGNRTWTNTGANPVRLGTSGPAERQSALCDSTWISCSRPALLKEASVAPGQTGTFEFWVKSPASGGSFKEYFTPLSEGISWMNDIGLFYTITSQPATYTWQMTSQYAYTDTTKTTVKNMASLLPGEKVYVGFTAKNTGNITWTNTGSNPVIVGTLSPYERLSQFSQGSNWISGTRPALLKEASVAPGQTGTFEFWMTAPLNSSGVYNERFGLLMEGVRWLNDIGLSYYANVQPATYTWQMTSQYAYTDTTKTTVKNMASLLPGEKVYVGFTAKNTGNITWTNTGSNPVIVGTLSPYERLSQFSQGSNWISGTRPALLKEASVAPGQTGTFEFWMTAPLNSSGVYNERFGLLMEGVRWLNDIGLSYYANVHN